MTRRVGSFLQVAARQPAGLPRADKAGFLHLERPDTATSGFITPTRNVPSNKLSIRSCRVSIAPNTDGSVRAPLQCRSEEGAGRARAALAAALADQRWALTTQTARGEDDPHPVAPSRPFQTKAPSCSGSRGDTLGEVASVITDARQ